MAFWVEPGLGFRVRVCGVQLLLRTGLAIGDLGTQHLKNLTETGLAI